MPGVTKEQIRQAREADLFAYLERHERGVLKRDGPNYRHIRSIRIISKEELQIEFNYQDEYQKAVRFAEQMEQAKREERRAG